MKKTVLFLGAGMSASFGYPLTSDILPGILKRLKNGSLFNEIISNKEIAVLYRKLLTSLIVSLSPGLAPLIAKDSPIDNKEKLPMVTELLSQLDYLIATNQAITDWNFETNGTLLRGMKKINDRWEISNLKSLFDWAIISIIMKCRPKPSINVTRFMDHISRTNKKGRHFTSIISSNYDVALESCLLTEEQIWNADRYIDFGCSWRDPIIKKSVVYHRPVNPLHKIYKLHGSTDWLKCDRCGFLYINPTNEIYTLPFSNNKTAANSCHCGYWPFRPVLVTMSYIRKMEDSNLLEIWRNSLEELRTADEWIIVGYSLPPEDFDIRSIFLRALASHSRDLSIKVVQRSDNSKERYDMFFGKDQYTYYTGGFEPFAADYLQQKGRKAEKLARLKAKVAW